MDLFETLREKVQCQYISDLRTFWYKGAAREAVKGIDIGKYSLKELSDAAQYLYDKRQDFQSYAEAAKFFGLHE